MPLAPAVLDTDILSAVLKKEPAVLPLARAYLAEHGHFTLSILMDRCSA